MNKGVQLKDDTGNIYRSLYVEACIMTKIGIQLKDENNNEALLRNEIVRIYDTQMKLGYCSSFMKENVKDMYESYHMLKGNGLVTSMVNQLYDLPNEPRKGEQR